MKLNMDVFLIIFLVKGKFIGIKLKLIEYFFNFFIVELYIKN